jgi:transcriptional regulator GlxA family with amidase domain
MKSRKRVGLVLFDGVTALDLVGPADAFGCARQGPDGATTPAYEVVVLGVSRRSALAESGVRLTPDCQLDQAPPLDTLLVPGGEGLPEPATNLKVTQFIVFRRAFEQRFGINPSAYRERFRPSASRRTATTSRSI